MDALLHGDQPLIEIVRARGSVYGTLVALAVLVHTQRNRMGSAIDRRFFREHYDASRLLREVAAQARRAGSLERAAPAVVARIEAALQSLTAELPFPVVSRDTWRQSVLVGRYTPLDQHLPFPPGRLSEVFSRALAVDRAVRPPTAAAFLGDLESALG